MNGLYDNLGQTTTVNRRSADEAQIKHEITMLTDRLFSHYTENIPGLINIEKKTAIDLIHLFFDEELKRLEDYGTTT